MSGLISITVGKQLEKAARTLPDRIAVKYNDRDYCRTWRGFNEEVDRVARGFMALGLGRGDHIAIWATNLPVWLLTFFASAKIGAVLVTVNTAYKVFELEYLLRQSDTRALVLIDGWKDSDYVQIVNDLCPSLKNSAPGEYKNPTMPFLQHFIYCGERDTPAGMWNWDDVEAGCERTPEQDFRALTDSIDPQDVVNMQYTSGTTGFPKGVMLSHFSIINNGLSIGDCMKFTEDDKLCIVVPFFHCFGMVLALMACLTHMTSMVPVDLYSPVKVMKAISEERCTAFHGVPTMYIGMLGHPDFEKYDFSHMRTGIMAGSPCPMEVMRQVVEKMHMPDITITYGQTEASPATTMSTTEDSLELRVETVGRHMPFVETKIVDPETGRKLGPGETGEFCSRGYNTMKGYYKMEEATRQAIDGDGWLHSGDLAAVDENGYYRITGRMRDMIIRGGENIYPKELEEFLYTHPAVADVQVIGVPSERYGEEIMACIIRKPGMELTSDEVKDYFRRKLARHKVPKYVEFFDAFPMTASGKIQKFRLRDWAAEKISEGKNEEEHA